MRQIEVRTGDEDSEMRSEITVRYRPDAELGIWVPREMKERYETPQGHHLEATAKYSDFQQFRVSVETELARLARGAQIVCGFKGRDGLHFALEPLFDIRISSDMLRQQLDGDGAIQAGVSGFVHLAHSSSAEWGLDFIGADLGAGSDGHGGQGEGTRRFSSSNQFWTRSSCETAACSSGVTIKNRCPLGATSYP